MKCYGIELVWTCAGKLVGESASQNSREKKTISKQTAFSDSSTQQNSDPKKDIVSSTLKETKVASDTTKRQTTDEVHRERKGQSTSEVYEEKKRQFGSSTVREAQKCKHCDGKKDSKKNRCSSKSRDDADLGATENRVSADFGCIKSRNGAEFSGKDAATLKKQHRLVDVSQRHGDGKIVKKSTTQGPASDSLKPQRDQHKDNSSNKDFHRGPHGMMKKQKLPGDQLTGSHGGESKHRKIEANSSRGHQHQKSTKKAMMESDSRTTTKLTEGRNRNVAPARQLVERAIKACENVEFPEAGIKVHPVDMMSLAEVPASHRSLDQANQPEGWMKASRHEKVIILSVC